MNGTLPAPVKVKEGAWWFHDTFKAGVNVFQSEGIALYVAFNHKLLRTKWESSLVMWNCSVTIA